MPAIGVFFYIGLFVIMGCQWIFFRLKGKQCVMHGPLNKFFCLLYLFCLYTIPSHLLGWPYPARLNQLMDTPRWLVWCGIMLCCIGMLGAIRCMWFLGNNFTFGIADTSEKTSSATGFRTSDDNANGTLITKGPYAYSRNPFFCFLILWYTGITFLLPSIIMLFIPIFFIFLVHQQIVLEECVLRKHYGQKYADYCQNVPRYL